MFDVRNMDSFHCPYSRHQFSHNIDVRNKDRHDWNMSNYVRIWTKYLSLFRISIIHGWNMDSDTLHIPKINIWYLEYPEYGPLKLSMFLTLKDDVRNIDSPNCPPVHIPDINSKCRIVHIPDINHRYLEHGHWILSIFWTSKVDSQNIDSFLCP